MTNPGTMPAIKHIPVNEALNRYVSNSSSMLDDVMRSLVERTAEAGHASGMMTTVEQASLLTILARLLGATTALDVGTFTGVSALALARGIAPGGRVITCDVTDQWQDAATEHWRRAGVADRIDFRLGAALKTLRGLPMAPLADIAFIDADKLNYPKYYAELVPRLRAGGLLIADNVLLDGYVLDPELAGGALLRASAEAMRGFNAAVVEDDRITAVMLPIGDGLTIALKR